MRSDISKMAFAALLFLPQAWGTTVNRCEDDSGRMTFTTLSCPAGQRLELQEAYNATPGSISTAPSSSEAQKKTPKAEREIVVVGQHDDGCGNVLSADQRRRAILNLQTPAGMSKRDVESMLGTPDKVTIRNQETRYVYDSSKDKKNKVTRTKSNRSQQVTFDENGCVKKR